MVDCKKEVMYRDAMGYSLICEISRIDQCLDMFPLRVKDFAFRLRPILEDEKTIQFSRNYKIIQSTTMEII